jgi:hypothetical protein
MSQPKKSLLGSEEGGSALPVESVGDILEREVTNIISDWLRRVSGEADLMTIPLNFEARTGHLPQFLGEVVARLRLINNTDAVLPHAATQHGKLRYAQGYTVPMLVVESRLLQVSIFSILHRNVKSLEFAALPEPARILLDAVRWRAADPSAFETILAPGTDRCN